MESFDILDFVFKVSASIAAVVLIAQFGKFQIPFELYYLRRLVTLSDPDISKDIVYTTNFNEMFKVSKLIYTLNGVYKSQILLNPKSTAIGFYGHFDEGSNIARKDLFNSISKSLIFRLELK
ncbi:MAG: hypothetical protein HC932_05280 [Thermales bacterium]|nr:hypothetical protein [Thermales bacterium]